MTNFTDLEKSFLIGLFLANRGNRVNFAKSWEEQNRDAIDLLNPDDELEGNCVLYRFAPDVANLAGIPMTRARGVMSSLIKKGIFTFMPKDEYGYKYDVLSLDKEGFEKLAECFGVLYKSMK